MFKSMSMRYLFIFTTIVIKAWVTKVVTMRKILKLWNKAVENIHLK